MDPKYVVSLITVIFVIIIAVIAGILLGIILSSTLSSINDNIIIGTSVIAIPIILLKLDKMNNKVISGSSERKNWRSSQETKEINGPELRSFKLPASDFNRCTFNKFDKNLQNMLLTGKKPLLQHFPADAKFADNFSRILDWDGPRMEYKRRSDEFKMALHWGQLKLMLTEVEFLTMVLKRHQEENDKRPIYFVYAGAAPGHHTKYLGELFPMIKFELYDPNDFVVKDSDQIKTHVQFFTDQDAKHWADQTDKYVVFCSDIRTEPATPENVVRNMAMQLEWWRIINPELSMFKFRLPWDNGSTTYPKGTIYIQPYPGPTSTETRLIVEKNAEIITYDNKHYEELCMYHNNTIRKCRYHCSLGDDLQLGSDLLDNCYDCVSFVHIATEYLAATKQPADRLLETIHDIQRRIVKKLDVKIKTIDDFNERLGTFYNMARDKAVKCDTAHGKPHKLRGRSRATEDNERAYHKSIGLHS